MSKLIFQYGLEVGTVLNYASLLHYTKKRTIWVETSSPGVYVQAHKDTFSMKMIEGLVEVTHVVDRFTVHIKLLK